MLQRRSGEPELLRALKAVLSRNLANGRVALADSASALELTPRTLQRRLDAFGQSYQRVLDAVRRHAAENLLRDQHVSLTQSAFLRGYTEPSTRSEERRVGKEGVRTGRSRWAAYH